MTQGRAMPDQPDTTEVTMTAIQRWSGISLPNAAARHGLGDFIALIEELEALHGSMAFEDEPSSFEAALRDCREAGR